MDDGSDHLQGTFEEEKEKKNFMRRYVGDRMYGGANPQQLKKKNSPRIGAATFPPPSPVPVHSDSLVYSVTGC